jgi:hypothetical protein
MVVVLILNALYKQAYQSLSSLLTCLELFSNILIPRIPHTVAAVSSRYIFS